MMLHIHEHDYWFGVLISTLLNSILLLVVLMLTYNITVNIVTSGIISITVVVIATVIYNSLIYYYFRDIDIYNIVIPLIVPILIYAGLTIALLYRYANLVTYR